jgi:electron transfer flavoprotein beta subunit
MIAEGLNSPYISIASKLDVNGNTLTLEREITGGVEVVEVALPVVVSCAKGMAEQRIPNMRGIMAARTKPLQVLAPTVTETLTSYVTFASPQAKSSVKLIDPNNMDELVSLLHNEAKVI